MRDLLKRLETIEHLNCDEASYQGNLGYSEMIKFYKIASNKDIEEMEMLLKVGDYKAVWKLLQRVTKTNLGSMKGKWNPKIHY